MKGEGNGHKGRIWKGKECEEREKCVLRKSRREKRLVCEGRERDEDKEGGREMRKDKPSEETLPFPLILLMADENTFGKRK